MEWLWLLWIGSVLGLISLFVGPIAWLVLGGVTLALDARSRKAAATGADVGVMDATSFGRPARILATIAVGSIAAYAALTAAAYWLRLPEPIASVLGFGGLAIYCVAPPALVALGAMLIAAIVDMARKRRVAGRDTAIAYAVILPAQVAILAAVWGLSASGAGLII